jgi:hypothetical protein
MSKKYLPATQESNLRPTAPETNRMDWPRVAGIRKRWESFESERCHPSIRPTR